MSVNEKRLIDPRAQIREKEESDLEFIMMLWKLEQNILTWVPNE